MSKKRLKSDKLSSKKCAVGSCDSENKIVYDFPHPAKNRKQFFEWLSLCRNDEVENMDVEDLYNLHGICEKHFERRTANIHESVPTLELPANNGSSLKNEVCEASQLCRLCFNTGSVDVFSCKYYKKLLRDIVKTFIPIEIKKDDVSTLVCEYCKCEVIRFYNFLLKSLQVDEYFRAISKEVGNDEAESFGSLMLVEPNVSLIKIEEDEDEVFTVKEEEENDASSPVGDVIDKNKSSSSPKMDPDDSDNKTESDNEEDGNYVPPYVIQYFHTYVKRPSEERAKNKTTKAEISNEIVQDSENGDTIICIHCDKTIESIEEFREHCKSENHSPLFTCPECNRIFKDQIALDVHSTVHGKDNSGICDRCGKQFNKRDRLYTHINSVHNKSELKFECRECPRKFATNYRLKMHMRIHNNDRPYCCEQCGAVFTMSTNLRNHQMIHSDHKPFICVICNKGFRRRSKLAIHLTKHTGERKYSCEKCGIAYKRKLNLIRHNKKNHTNPNEEIDAKPRVCTQCNFVCNFSAQLKYHMLKVHKSYTCTICNMSFKNYQPYYNHKFKHYPNKKKFVCNYCDKRFINATLLNVHMVVHTGKKNFECEICNKRFSQRPHLQSHLLTHTGEKPHKCKFCNKSFAHLSTLVVHERIHTGETPYVCHICQKGFGHLTNYKKHLFSQHGVIMPKKRDYSKLRKVSQQSNVEDTASELIDFLKSENEEVIIEGDVMEVTEGSFVEVAEDIV